jgi:hypothetical protein
MENKRVIPSQTKGNGNSGLSTTIRLLLNASDDCWSTIDGLLGSHQAQVQSTDYFKIVSFEDRRFNLID